MAVSDTVKDIDPKTVDILEIRQKKIPLTLYNIYVI